VNPPGPEATGYTKFLLSVGVFLCVAAFVVWGLILRDNSALLVSEAELRELTPVAEKEIRDRQGWAECLGAAAPFIFFLMLTAGGLLIYYALPRLRRQEENEEQRGSMEREKLQRELEPQSPADKRAKRMEERGEEGVAPAAEADSWVRNAAAIEARVLARLAEVALPLFELRPRVRLPGQPALLLDAVLVSNIDQVQDIVVEIKFGGRHFRKNFINRLVEVVARLALYRERVGPGSVGWLIVVLEGSLAAEDVEPIYEKAAELDGSVRVTVIEESEIDELVLPIELG
jgi:hypothetical protein